MKIVPLEEGHLETLLSTGGVPMIASAFTPEMTKLMVEAKNTFTGLNAEGKPVICGGVFKYWENRGEAWAIIDQTAKEDFVGIFNSARTVIAACKLKRIEAYIPFDFKAGHRWIKLLGFELEAARLKAFRPDGSDSSLYVRIK